MKLKETSKFQKLRKKLKSESEMKELKCAIEFISENPETGKKLKGEFKNLRVHRYYASSQPRRLIYKIEAVDIILFSFGPREGIYK
jgi:hypothetical protein